MDQLFFQDFICLFEREREGESVGTQVGWSRGRGRGRRTSQLPTEQGSKFWAWSQDPEIPPELNAATLTE